MSGSKSLPGDGNRMVVRIGTRPSGTCSCVSQVAHAESGLQSKLMHQWRKVLRMLGREKDRKKNRKYKKNKTSK